MYISIGTIIVIVVIWCLFSLTEEQLKEGFAELWETVLAIVIVGAFLLTIAAIGYGILVYAKFI